MPAATARHTSGLCDMATGVCLAAIVTSVDGSTEPSPPAHDVTISVNISSSPVLIHVPHSSRHIPDWARASLLLSDDDLRLELDNLTDSHTDVLAERAAEACRIAPTLFINRLSRLVVDPERFADEREEMLQVGMGPVYTRGFAGRQLRVEDDSDLTDSLISAVFNPYSTLLSETVEQIVGVHGRAIIIDLHSFPRTALPYELHSDGPRPPVCLGVDAFHTPTDLAAAAESALAGFDPLTNTPFSGTYVPTRFFGRDSRVQSIMIEVRRDQYLQPDLTLDQTGAGALAAALARLIDSLA